MVAENIPVRIISFNFFFIRVLFSIKYRVFESVFVLHFSNSHQRVINLTREQFKFEGTGCPIDSTGHLSSARAGGASTTALLFIPLRDHLVEFGKSSASL